MPGIQDALEGILSVPRRAGVSEGCLPSPRKYCACTSTGNGPPLESTEIDEAKKRGRTRRGLVAPDSSPRVAELRGTGEPPEEGHNSSTGLSILLLGTSQNTQELKKTS